MKQTNVFAKLWHPIGKEFKRENFKLNHVPVDDFYMSQWQRDSKSIFFVLYRWLVALFFVGVVFSSMVVQFSGGRYFIYLTDWGFILCMVTFLYGAVLTTCWWIKTSDSVKQPTSIKIYWGIHFTTLVISIVITVVYWIFLYPLENIGGKEMRVFNIFQHACNSILMVVDHFVVAFPTRLLHIVYPLGLGVVYAIFSAIYYGSGGVDPFGNPFIYPILDWRNPGGAFITILGVLVLSTIVTLIVFGFYKLRHYIYKSINNTEIELPQ